MWVGKPRGNGDLAGKSLGADDAGDVRTQDLERYLAVVLQVACEVEMR
jgi:hypothetical protein